MTEYLFIEDPGHGWLRVPLEELVELGIADQITIFSYQDQRYAYLEEDLDAGTFARSKGLDLRTVPTEYQEYTNVRRLPSYQAPKSA